MEIKEYAVIQYRGGLAAVRVNEATDAELRPTLDIQDETGVQEVVTRMIIFFSVEVIESYNAKGYEASMAVGYDRVEFFDTAEEAVDWMLAVMEGEAKRKEGEADVVRQKAQEIKDKYPDG